MREGIQRSLKGAAVDTVHNMGLDAPLDTIIKKFSIIYGNVKSYDILMGDFYHADQVEDETVTSFATRIEGLLSYVRNKFPNQIPLAKEQELLKDRLFCGCQKSIRDSVKYRHADPSVEYMTFLEECRKAEDEDGVGKSKSKGKVKIAAATAISSTQNDALAKQLKRQQQHFDTLLGKVQAMVTTLQSYTAQATSSFRQGNPSFGMRERGRIPFHNNGGRGVPGGRCLPPQARWRGQPQPQSPNSQPNVTQAQQEQGNVRTYVDNLHWQCGEMGHLKRNCPMLKGKGLFQVGNVLTAPLHKDIPPAFLKPQM